MIRFFKAAVLIIFVLTVYKSNAQSYIGVFGGLNSSRLAGDVPDDAKYKGLMGANVGAYVDIKLAKIVWLSLQPSYSQEGTKVSYTLSGQAEPVDSIKIRLNYFSLPLLVKVSSTNGKFYAIGGIETAFLLSHDLSSHGENQESDLSISDINVAAHFGAGIRIPIGLPRLVLELRYTQGLIDLTDEPVDRSYIPRVKTIGFKFLAGIEIPLSRNKQ